MTTSASRSDILRVLVVDDERMNREILSHLLRKEGHLPISAAHGAEALDLLSGGEFDLVLLDVNMPELDGFQCLAELRKTKSTHELPVVMVTADTDRATILRSFEGGANDFITKPIDPQLAMARIGMQLRLRESQKALRTSEERYALAAKGANDGLWDWDFERSSIYLSPRWKEMLGYGDDELSAVPAEWLDRMHHDDAPKLKALLNPGRWQRESQFEMELRMRHRDGTYRWMHCRGVALPAADGAPRRMSGSLTDITSGKVGDSLTGLPNRLLFLERLERTCDRARRIPGTTFAVLFLDLDKFKLVNDSLGHHIGDQLLTAAAGRLEACVRNTDSVSRRRNDCTVARIGGDEFTILLNDLSNPEDAVMVAKRIIDAFSEPFSLDGNEVIVGTSIGIAIGGDDHLSPSELMQEADTAMYFAKSEGRGSFRAFDPVMQQFAAKRLRLEQDLRRSMQADDFYLNYQPIVRLSDNSLTGFEALVRWRNPNGESVGPDVFVPAAEELGLIVPLGKWIMRHACIQAAKWSQRFKDAPPLVVNINCSILQLQQADFIEEVERTLVISGVDPKLVKIEVTESTLMKKPEFVGPIMQKLRDMGLRIGIDDFGTGYSSLAYLHRLPLDMLKIDRSFISTMTETSESLEIVRTIINLARGLHLDVVAEGVETESQRNLLLDLGCTHVQGYLISRPLGVESAEKMAAHWGTNPDLTPGEAARTVCANESLIATAP